LKVHCFKVHSFNYVGSTYKHSFFDEAEQKTLPGKTFPGFDRGVPSEKFWGEFLLYIMYVPYPKDNLTKDNLTGDKFISFKQKTPTYWVGGYLYGWGVVIILLVGGYRIYGRRFLIVYRRWIGI